MPHQPMGSGEEHDDIDEGQGNAEHVTVEQRLELRGRIEDWRAVVEHEGDPAIGAEPSQGGDEGGYSPVGRYEPIERADAGAKNEGYEDGRPEPDPPKFQATGEDHREQRDHRSRAQINTADEDHGGGADREKRDNADLKRKIIQVAPNEEAIGGGHDEQRHDDGGDDRSGQRMGEQSLHAAAVPSSALPKRSALLNSLALAIRTIWPRRTTATRSDIASSSRSSELMRRTPLPAAVISSISR